MHGHYPYANNDTNGSQLLQFPMLAPGTHVQAIPAQPHAAGMYGMPTMPYGGAFPPPPVQQQGYVPPHVPGVAHTAVNVQPQQAEAPAPAQTSAKQRLLTIAGTFMLGAATNPNIGSIAKGWLIGLGLVAIVASLAVDKYTSRQQQDGIPPTPWVERIKQTAPQRVLAGIGGMLLGASTNGNIDDGGKGALIGIGLSLMAAAFVVDKCTGNGQWCR